MIELYNNEFENVDENSIAAALNDFTSSLEKINYDTINTNAKYDTTFNNGFSYLKNTDIGTMINLCNECKTQIVDQIKTYKSDYQAYKTAYSNYVTAYENYTSAQETYNQWINNGKKGTEPSIPSQPDSSSVTSAETNLKDLANKIKNATFN